MQIRWKNIEGYKGKYLVSEEGAVMRSDGKLVGQWDNDQGYMFVRLSNPRKTIRVHRLVAQEFIQNPKNLPFVNHKDCNPANNHVENLEWCTQWGNLNHSQKLGRMQRNYWSGKRSPNAYLSDIAATQIRQEYSAGEVSWEALGKKYKCSKRTIGRIINGESYV